MNDLNLCQFIGRLGKPAEQRFMPNGKAVANFSIACNKSWKDQNGAKQERAEWIRCTAYDKLAEIICQYTQQGSRIYVSGEQATRQWQDQQGNDRYTTEVIVKNMQLLDPKQDSNNQRQQGGNQNNGYQQQSGQRPQGNNQNRNQQQNGNGQQAQGNQQQNQGNPPPLAEPDFNFDEDLPFIPLFKQYRGMHYAV